MMIRDCNHFVFAYLRGILQNISDTEKNRGRVLGGGRGIFKKDRENPVMRLMCDVSNKNFFSAKSKREKDKLEYSNQSKRPGVFEDDH